MKNNNIFGTSLNKSFLENIRMPFPNKDAQEHIVSILLKIDEK